MTRECHVRLWEGLRVKLPRSTHQSASTTVSALFAWLAILLFSTRENARTSVSGDPVLVRCLFFGYLCLPGLGYLVFCVIVWFANDLLAGIEITVESQLTFCQLRWLLILY